jgi:hypothetical protein
MVDGYGYGVWDSQMNCNTWTLKMFTNAFNLWLVFIFLYIMQAAPPLESLTSRYTSAFCEFLSVVMRLCQRAELVPFFLFLGMCFGVAMRQRSIFRS